jgi:hypothetical protein
MYRRLFPYDDKYAGDDPDPPPPDPYDDTGPPDDVDPDDGQPPQRPAASAAAVDKSVGTIRALRVDPSTGWLLPPVGVRVDFGRAKDYFTGAVRQFVLERFRVCAFPGCAMPMSCLDADHWKARKDGGATDASTNAGPGCPHHNRTTRNRPGWDVEPNGDGTATLITPQGRRYPITPLNYLDT